MRWQSFPFTLLHFSTMVSDRALALDLDQPRNQPPNGNIRLRSNLKSATKMEGNNTKVGTKETNLIDVLCNNETIKFLNNVFLHRSNLYQERLNNKHSPAFPNTWYTFMELEYSFELLCAGIELKQPQAQIKNGQISMSAKLRKDPVNIDMYCDNKHQ